MSKTKFIPLKDDSMKIEVKHNNNTVYIPTKAIEYIEFASLFTYVIQTKWYIYGTRRFITRKCNIRHLLDEQVDYVIEFRE